MSTMKSKKKSSRKRNAGRSFVKRNASAATNQSVAVNGVKATRVTSRSMKTGSSRGE